jgi:hypothetical protein
VTDANEPSPPEKDGLRRDAPWVVQAICGLVIALSALLVSTFDYGRDQAIYALVGREMLGGGMPYADAFDFKPPGVFVVYAFARALFGADQTGIRLLEVATMLGDAALLVQLSRRHFRSATAGWIAAAIASQVHAQLDFWHTAQPETFGATLTLGALLLCPDVRLGTSSRRETLRETLRWVGVGALFGAAGLMKPPLAGVAIVPAIAATLKLWHVRRQGEVGVPVFDLARPLLATGLGGVLPIAATAVWFSATGALDDLKQVLFVFTPYYTKLSWEGVSTTAMVWFGITEWLSGYSGILLAGLIALAVARPRPPELGFVLVLLGAIFIHVAGIVLQGKFFPYHWAATFPLTALLAGRGIERAYEELARFGLWGTAPLGAGLLAALVLRWPVPSFGNTFVERSQRRLELLTGPSDLAAWDALATVADVDAGQNRAVAEFVKTRTAGQESEPIFVWGFECVIYDLAERPIASRFIYDVPQRAEWSKAPMEAELMRDLAARPPSVIVVEHHDVFPQVTGNNLDSAGALYRFTALSELLQNQYGYEKTIGDFDVYYRYEDPPQEP